MGLISQGKDIMSQIQETVFFARAVSWRQLMKAWDEKLDLMPGSYNFKAGRIVTDSESDLTHQEKKKSTSGPVGYSTYL